MNYAQTGWMEGRHNRGWCSCNWGGYRGRGGLGFFVMSCRHEATRFHWSCDNQSIIAPPWLLAGCWQGMKVTLRKLLNGLILCCHMWYKFDLTLGSAQGGKMWRLMSISWCIITCAVGIWVYLEKKEEKHGPTVLESIMCNNQTHKIREAPAVMVSCWPVAIITTYTHILLASIPYNL